MTIKLEELRAFVDGEIDTTRSAEIERLIASDPNLAEQAAAMEASQLPYRAAYMIDEDKPPARLRDTIESWVVVSDAVKHSEPTKPARPQWMFAAAMVAALGLGAIASAMIFATPSTSTLPQWAKRVAEYQSLYVRATVQSSADAAGHADELLAALTQRTGLETARPDLSAEGYTFVRAQELGFEGQPLVQLVYLGDGDVPLALCYMPGTVNGTTTGVHAGLAVTSWSQDKQRFVIVADESPETMERLQQQASSTWL